MRLTKGMKSACSTRCRPISWPRGGASQKAPAIPHDVRKQRQADRVEVDQIDGAISAGNQGGGQEHFLIRDQSLAASHRNVEELPRIARRCTTEPNTRVSFTPEKPPARRASWWEVKVCGSVIGIPKGRLLQDSVQAARRALKYATVSLSPSSNVTVGIHPKVAFANVISG